MLVQRFRHVRTVTKRSPPDGYFEGTSATRSSHPIFGLTARVGCSFRGVLTCPVCLRDEGCLGRFVYPRRFPRLPAGENAGRNFLCWRGGGGSFFHLERLRSFSAISIRSPAELPHFYHSPFLSYLFTVCCRALHRDRRAKRSRCRAASWRGALVRGILVGAADFGDRRRLSGHDRVFASHQYRFCRVVADT